jgi:pilus assembly protein CpaD
MTEPFKNCLRGLSLVAILMASSCAGPNDGPNPGFEDGLRNHPIAVEPSYQSIKVAYSPADQGLSTSDAARFNAFVNDYRVHGSGSIAISAPSGMNATVAIAFFAERINAMGISRDHILVSSHDAPSGDTQVELNYVAYRAHTDACGDWSEDLSMTLENDTPKNFGCAVQQNIAAQVADPRDLLGPRGMDDGDGRRRQTVINNYDQGKPTPADKTSSQSGMVSDVNKQ